MNQETLSNTSLPHPVTLSSLSNATEASYGGIEGGNGSCRPHRNGKLRLPVELGYGNITDAIVIGVGNAV